MKVTVTLPQMGESVVEGTVERWLVHEGDAVEKDQTLCEVTTDKVDAEIPAPEAGVVANLLVPAGQTVPVGTELCVLDTGAAAAKAPRAVPTAKPAPAVAAAASAPAADVRSSPVARRIAAEHGVDLARVPPGPEGRVGKAEVTAHLERATAPRTPGDVAAASAATAPGKGSLLDFLARMRVPTYAPRESDRVIPFTAIRRRIAEHMVVSKIVSPHVGTVAEVDLARTVQVRERAKDTFEREHGFKLTYLPFVVQAAVRGLRDFPRMNSAVVGETIVERAGIHVGVAVETERGLVVPVIRDADRYSLVGLAEAIQELATRARAREITADELQGGTFTVTNPGREGNLYGFAVINQPQVGILRIGEVRKRPVVVERDGEDLIAIRPTTYLALSYDHRVIDGVTGNGFLYRVAKYLEAGEFEV